MFRFERLNFFAAVSYILSMSMSIGALLLLGGMRRIWLEKEVPDCIDGQARSKPINMHS